MKKLLIAALLVLSGTANASVIWNIGKYSPNDREISPRAKIESFEIMEGALTLNLVDRFGTIQLTIPSQEIRASAGMTVKEMIELITEAQNESHEELTFFAQRKDSLGNIHLLRIMVRYLD